MGLDMYLRRKVHMKPSAVKVLNSEGKEVEGLDFSEVTAITQKVMYWRKANAIHQWFVDNVQEGMDDCKPYELEFLQLAELREVCAKVLENPELAEELLPPQEGFFFGSTEVDEMYLQDLRDTVKAIDAEDQRLTSQKVGYDEDIWGVWYEYQSSW